MFQFFCDESISLWSRSCQKSSLEGPACLPWAISWEVCRAACTGSQSPSSSDPSCDTRVVQYIQLYWLLPFPTESMSSSSWCNGGCLPRVVSWLMQLLSLLVTGSPRAFFFPLSCIFLSIPWLYVSLLPSPCSHRSGPLLCKRWCVGGSGSA